MGTLNEDLTSIKAIEDKLTANKVANFAYTDHAYANPLTEADGVEYYDVNKEQNIPLPDPSIMNVNETVLTKGWRSQASAITRMLMNHFLGRVSYNLNKLNDNMSSLLATLMSHLGSANGIAPLNANGLLDINKGGTNASTVEGARANLDINNVVNTGDSAVPVSDGTTKFTTGGAYTELNKKADKTQLAGYQPNNFLNLSSNDANDVDTGIKCYRVNQNCANIPVAKIGLLNSYKYVNGQYIRITQEYTQNDDTVSSAKKYLRWGMSNNSGVAYTWSNWQQVADNADVNLKADLADLAPAFSTSTSYEADDYVVYNGDLYRCTNAHSAGVWNSSHFTIVTAGGELSTINRQLNGAMKRLSTGSNGPYWIKALECSYHYVGQIIHLDIVSQYSSSQGASHALTICLSNNAENIIDLARDANLSFDKIRIYSATAQRKALIYIHYAKSDSDPTASSFTFTQLLFNGAILHWTKEEPPSDIDYREYKLLSNGFNILGALPNLYINGQNRLPSAPAVDGNYALSASVVNDTPSFSWVEKTPVPEQNSNKLFTAGGAFDFFGGNTKANSWLGKVFYWALGRKWSEGLTNTGVGFNTVYYANGLWHGCATNNSNGLWWSDNGKDWNAISVSSCSDVYYANGMWVAGGAKVYWSIDGKTWTQGTGLANNNIITHVRYANGIWVAVLQAIGLVWSTDGKAWSEAKGATASEESPMDYVFGSLYYANGLWVAGGSAGLWFSENGKNWTKGSGAVTGYLFKSICYDEVDGLWVAVSNGKGAYWSNNGIQWTAGSANQANAQFQSVTHNDDGLWVAVSQGGTDYKGIWWSEDGKTWTHVTGETSNIAFWLIYYANGIWVAGGNSCGLWWSKDGKRWLKGTSESSLFDTMNFDSAYCADGIWLAGGTTLHGAYYSDYSNADIQ